MKRLVYLILPTIILAACGGEESKEAQLAKLKKERSELDVQIKTLEGQVKKVQNATPVSVMTIQSGEFTSFIEVQSQVTGDENINATPQAPGIIERVLVKPGQAVGRGQVLATLDASAVEQQIKALEPQIAFQMALYDKQQKLWAQNIGTEVQLMSTKAQYETLLKQKAALIAQRNMFTIKSPISGTVDAVNVKEGDAINPGGNGTAGIRVVSKSKMKATADLGENYLGKVKQGDKVNLIFTETGETVKTNLSYVAGSVDPISRAFRVEVNLGNNPKLYPNMSCKMQIANYESGSAITVPISVVQKTGQGDLIYVVEGNKAKAVPVTIGRIYNGNAEILSGLKAGDKVIVEGAADLDNGELVAIK